MSVFSAPTARIVLRYAAGFLVAKGVLSSEMGGAFSVDPDVLSLVETGVGLLITVGTELWYKVAKKLGWAT